MIHNRKMAAVAMTLAVAGSLLACSSTGGRQAVERASGVGAGKADTPKMTVAMVTHQAPGDTFWDIVRKGAEAASTKDNVQLDYAADPDAAKQAQLIQAAIDKKVDGIAVTMPNTGAIGPTIEKAVAAGIPVTMFNAGGTDAMGLGVLGYFGQGETEAGIAVGERLVEAGAKNAICVIQEQGQQQLEDRCAGVAEGAKGVKVERAYVNGRDDAAVTTTVQASLTTDKTIDWVITLGAPVALNAVKAVEAAGSSAKIGTFDTNAELVKAVQEGKVAWAIDQQPYLQGYLAVDALWLYKNNGNTIGGGNNVATGPAFIDETNIEAVAKFAAGGTR